MYFSFYTSWTFEAIPLFYFILQFVKILSYPTIVFFLLQFVSILAILLILWYVVDKRENFPEIHLLKNLVICRMLITINYINLNWDVMFKNIYLHYYLLLPQHRFSLFEAHNVIPNTVREQLEMGSWIPKHNTSKSYVPFNYIVYFYPLSHDFFLLRILG